MLHEGDIVPHVVWWKFTGSGGAVAAVSLNTVVAQVNAPATHEYTTQHKPQFMQLHCIIATHYRSCISLLSNVVVAMTSILDLVYDIVGLTPS